MRADGNPLKWGHLEAEVSLKSTKAALDRTCQTSAQPPDRPRQFPDLDVIAIFLRRRDRGMAEEFRDGDHVPSPPQRPDRKGMPQGLGRNPPGITKIKFPSSLVAIRLRSVPSSLDRRRCGGSRRRNELQRFQKVEIREVL